jgi:hypothetical protein
MSVSLIFTGPTSPRQYQRKLLQRHNSGEATNPLSTGLAVNVVQLFDFLLLRPDISVTSAAKAGS